VIPLLLFFGWLVALVSLQPIPAATGIQNGAANLFFHVLAPVAFAVFATLLLLLVRSMVLGRYHDSR
jgi:hypothetical protein